jgi:DNA-binding beta-propeller fold protein YncE
MKIVFWGLGFLICIGFFVSCTENDCPICPDVDPEPVPDYDIFVGSASQPMCKIYNTNQKSFVDSFAIALYDDIAVSGDGTKIIATYRRPQYKTAIVDLATKKEVRSYRYFGFIEVSSTGAYVALHHDSLIILDGTSFDVVLIDTTTLRSVKFGVEDSLLYGVYGTSQIRVLNIKNGEFVRSIDFVDDQGLSPHITELQPVSDNKIFLEAQYTMYEARLLAYYLREDSVALFLRGVNFREIRLTPDGYQIVATEPGDPFIGNIGSAEIYFVDPARDVVISSVHAGRSIRGSPPTGFYPGRITFTPDSKYTFVAALGGGGQAGLIDNVTHQFVDVEENYASYLQVSTTKKPNAH